MKHTLWQAKNRCVESQCIRHLRSRYDPAYSYYCIVPVLRPVLEPNKTLRRKKAPRIFLLVTPTRETCFVGYVETVVRTTSVSTMR